MSESGFNLSKVATSVIFNNLRHCLPVEEVPAREQVIEYSTQTEHITFVTVAMCLIKYFRGNEPGSTTLSKNEFVSGRENSDPEIKHTHIAMALIHGVNEYVIQFDVSVDDLFLWKKARIKSRYSITTLICSSLNLCSLIIIFNKSP